MSKNMLGIKGLPLEESIPMPWDKLTPKEEITMNKQKIIEALDNLRELGVSRRKVIRTLISQVKYVFGEKK